MTARCYAAAQDVLPSLALIVDDAFIEHMRLGRKQLEEYYPVFCLAVLPRRTYFEGVFLSLGSRFSRCLFLCRSALRSLEDDMLDTFAKAAGQRNERACIEPFGSQDREDCL